MTIFNTTYPIILTVLCLLIGALFAYLLYGKQYKKKELLKSKINTLFVLRFLSVSAVSFLLLEPFLTINEPEKEYPVWVMARDVSNSIPKGTNDKIQSLSDEIGTAFSESSEVKELYFAGLTSQNIDDSLQINLTDYSQLEEFVDEYYNRDKVAGMLLFTDGITNQGKALNYVFNDDYPVFTVGLGDTTIYPDVLIKEVYHNELVYSGNEYPVEVQVQSINLNQKSSQRLKIWKNDTLKLDSLIRLEANEVKSIQTYLKASNAKNEKVRIQIVSGLDKEINTNNNEQTVLIETINDRQNVLFVSNTPHPDNAFFLDAISRNLQYEIDYVSYNEVITTKPYNIIVFSGFPENYNDLTKLFNDAINNEKHVLILTRNSNQLGNLQKLGIGFQLRRLNNSLNDIFPIINKEFDLFELNSSFAKSLKSVPPVKMQFAQFIFSQGQSLFTQKIGEVATETPLFHVVDKNSSKVALLFGEGYWKWRMHDFRLNDNGEAWQGFVKQVFRLLSVKEKREQFQVKVRPFFKQYETVRISSQVFNEAYELMENATIKCIIRGDDFEQGKIFTGTDGDYRVEFGSLPQGTYSYTCFTQFGGQDFEVKGSFEVESENAETMNLVANHDVLKQVAIKSGGAFFDLTIDTESMKSEILKKVSFKPTLYDQITTRYWYEFKWLLLLFVVLWTTEWLLRKAWGLS